ncbi:hypothetical protein OG978_46535 (plasmid) [Streptomyces sp. NBC_01591]|uniref:hypothetical protein n=1 Tax=Streptomyces sp. NBC_01591 TaxID=2975888 RepID=UPI002DD79F2F|nr:hypothetical protein [Streptomyces sp. NBC_01591]WSD66131.1 hypothetical protein OG978_00895 [Streptomyces sp. NBC_01591]WSD72986.1 hypothetical protein OG978_39935 [Streptomyces sp. NBC_01591]WSD73737.1 hypothetical protein OG978_41710 [Streptomyces sp. NBC_01591]WSD74475.1 hypothetical protein OG978_46535 [Streptomyces sp. NBC_01591]
MAEVDEQQLFTEACLHGLRARLCDDVDSLDGYLPPQVAGLARKVAEILEEPQLATPWQRASASWFQESALPRGLLGGGGRPGPLKPVVHLQESTLVSQPNSPGREPVLTAAAAGAAADRCRPPGAQRCASDPNPDPRTRTGAAVVVVVLGVVVAGSDD